MPWNSRLLNGKRLSSRILLLLLVACEGQGSAGTTPDPIEDTAAATRPDGGGTVPDEPAYYAILPLTPVAFEASGSGSPPAVALLRNGECQPVLAVRDAAAAEVLDPAFRALRPAFALDAVAYDRAVVRDEVLAVASDACPHAIARYIEPAWDDEYEAQMAAIFEAARSGGRFNAGAVEAAKSWLLPWHFGDGQVLAWASYDVAAGADTTRHTFLVDASAADVRILAHMRVARFDHVIPVAVIRSRPDDAATVFAIERAHDGRAGYHYRLLVARPTSGADWEIQRELPFLHFGDE